jgi:transcriptional regulator with XRE-family HTH domain
MQGRKQKKMLEELGFSAGFLTALGTKSGIPSINRVGKMASYLNVSTDYLLGVHAPGKAPKDVLREVYLAMPKKDQQAALGEKINAFASAPDQREIVMAQFLAMRSHLQKNAERGC